MLETQVQRGGVRRGAGRKPSGRVQYITRLEPVVIDIIKRRAVRENKSECEIVSEALAQQFKI